MQIIKRVGVLRSLINREKEKKKRIGFVPTMGALHEGHLSLIRGSKKENGLTILSIFVNPIQFGPKEDFKSYPRDQKKDIFLAKKGNVDIIFYPSIMEMYPSGYKTYIEVEDLSWTLCGRSRPGHFRGVTTIVAKLLNILSPDVIYLGQKDAQQCAIIERMVRDLNFPTKVKIMPTIRESDGLALSSRNQYLSAQQRKEAAILYQSLLLAKEKISKGVRSSSQIISLITKNIKRRTSGRIDYVECVDGSTLMPLKILRGKIIIALAVLFEKARLIDNVTVKV